jgi:hypothetical protein
MTTSYTRPAPVPLRGALLVLMLDMSYERGVSARLADVAECQCEWCGEVDAVTVLRVYGQPRAEVLAPVELVECCLVCASTVVARARSEARDDVGDIVIEVAS